MQSAAFDSALQAGEQIYIGLRICIQPVFITERRDPQYLHASIGYCTKQDIADFLRIVELCRNRAGSHILPQVKALDPGAVRGGHFKSVRQNTTGLRIVFHHGPDASRA